MTIRTFKTYTPKIHETAYVDPTALVIGQVEMGADSSIWPMSVVRGDINNITIGERTNIQDGSILHVSHDGEYSPGGACMTIGNDVTVGHSVVLHACTLKDCCLIGIGSVILDNAVVHKHAMVGAGSLVTNGKELEGGYLWMGRPAKKVRELSEKEIKYLSYSANHYVKVKQMHESAED
jgi:carbonic anhydrase/acetyltransferase-like protein (isoleucine patch superfamily)